MGKVVHLTDDSHEKAKQYCKDAGISMSDWVSQLIEEGLSKVYHLHPAPVGKKPLQEMDSTRKVGAPIMEQPPFWSGRSGS